VSVRIQNNQTSDAVRTRLGVLVADLAAKRRIPHAVLRIERGDRSWRWEGAAGEARPGEPMRPDTAFRFASVAKLYTATAVLQLWERGSLDLVAPLADCLPGDLVAGLHRCDGVDHTDEITIRHLLSHTSGLPDYFLAAPQGETSYADRVAEGDFAYTIDDVVTRVRQLPAHFPPQDPAAARQRARYSDTNFQLLGAVIEAVTGRGFHQVVETQILEPLGLDDTWVAGHPRRETAGAPAALWAGDAVLNIPQAMASLGPDGGLVGTAADAIAFLRALLAGEPFARADTVGLMQARWNRFGLPRDRSSMMAPGWPIEYGLGILRFRPPWFLAPGRARPTLLGHTGASGSWLFHCPEHDLYLAGTVDQTTAAAVPYRIGPRLVRIAGTRRA
jgi:D-alanyl-D-alanine carboxypeptidase